MTLAVVAPPTIPSITTPPDPNDPNTFDTLALPWSQSVGAATTAVGTVAAGVYANALAAQEAAANAINAPGTSATSVSSLALATGSQSLTIQAGKAFAVGQFVVLANTPTPTNYMTGQITAYDPATGALVVNVSSKGGSGSYAAWTISLTAPVTGGSLTTADIGTTVQPKSAALDVWAGKTAPASVPVGTTDAQTLTNKTLTAPALSAPVITGYAETRVSANTTTAYTVDISQGTLQDLTLTANATLTFPAVSAGKGFMLILRQDGTGSRTVTWPASVKWPGSTAPTITATASKADRFTFVSDGAYWFGSTAGQGYL